MGVFGCRFRASVGHLGALVLIAGPSQGWCRFRRRNLLDHAPKPLHDEVSEDYRDKIYAKTAKEVEMRHKAFLRK